MNRKFNHQLLIILVHTMFWSLYVLLEYIANLPHLQGEDHFVFIRSTLLSLPVLMLPTYLIVLYAVPKLLMKRKILLFCLVVLVSAAFVFYGRLKWLELVNYINYNYSSPIPISKVLKNVIRDYAMIALAVCIYIISDWRKKERENIRLVKKKAKSDLELLKRQLHPHFLFNTLNNIYSLALKNLESKNQTVQSILKLSRLMEYLVYQSGEEEVALNEEIELIKNYINLEELRYGNDLDIQLDFTEVDNSIRTAPLILLPFVENCFKHGGRNEKGIFWIKIMVRVFEDRLTFFVSNSQPTRKKLLEKSGIGLHNISERLDLLYPEKYKLEIENSADFYSVNLELNKK